jgi:anti-anti-sigma factor
LNAQQDPSSPNPEVANFVLAEKWVGRVAVVSARGAIDMLTAPRLAESIRASQGKAPQALIIDLSEVDFLASAGMQVLVAAKEEAGSDVRFVVVADGPATSRPLKITGITDVIDLYPSLAQALENVTV